MFEYLMPLLVMPTYDAHAARRDLPRRRRAADRVRPRARRAVGRLRVGLQQDRRAPQLPVPRVRRARARVQARPGRRSRHRAVRQRDGADGRPRGGVREPAPARRARASSARTASTRRSTTRRRACRAGKDSVTVRSFMAHHQGMAFLSLAYLLLDRPMQRRFDVRPGVPGDRSAAAGARAAGRRAVYPHPAEVSRRAARRRPTPSSELPRLHHAEHARARGAPALQRPLPRRGHQRGRRLQPLARPGGHALARGPDARLLGHVLLPARRRRRGAFWSAAHQPTLQARRRSYEAIFSQGRAEFRRRDDDIDTHVEISVSPEDDIELRRISITNRGRTRAHDRADQLRRGRAGAAGGRRGAPGVQQPVRADRARPRRGRRSCARAGRARAASGRRG